MLRMLLRPRYLALSLLMIVIAAACVGLGTWQISRLQWKIRVNDQLRHNAHAAPAAVGTVLPLVGAADAPPAAHAVQFRTVTATGNYDTSGQVLVRNRTIESDVGSDDVPGSDTGYLVLTPLDTLGGTLLVVRGFISGTTGNGSLPAAAPPPTGPVTVHARVEPRETRHDDAARLGGRQVESINPVEQSTRLGRPVFDGYGELLDGQPGTAGLVAIPAPSLSNPAGGAYEWQHLAYVIQWYLFAALALAAPLAVSRHEVRDAQRQFLGIDPDARPELDSPELEAAPRADALSAPPAGAIAVRNVGAVQHRTPAEQDQIRRAERLADRYGLPLEVPDDRRVHATPPVARDRFVPAYERNLAPHPPGNTVHRSPDSYHGSYNDYLWQLALADGNIPDVAPPSDASDPTRRAADPQPPVIEAPSQETDDQA